MLRWGGGERPHLEGYFNPWKFPDVSSLRSKTEEGGEPGVPFTDCCPQGHLGAQPETSISVSVFVEFQSQNATAPLAAGLRERPGSERKVATALRAGEPGLSSLTAPSALPQLET